MRMGAASTLLLFIFSLYGLVLGVEEPTELIEGEVKRVTINESDGTSVLSFTNHNNVSNGVLYIKASTQATSCYVCKDDPVGCDDPNLRLTAMSNNKTDLKTYYGFVWGEGNYYVKLTAANGSEVSVLLFTTPQLYDNLPLKLDVNDGYNWTANEEYRYFHAYVCPDDREFAKFTSNAGPTFGGYGGQKPNENLADPVCSSGNNADNTCLVESGLKDGFYQFSFKKDATLTGLTSYDSTFSSTNPRQTAINALFSDSVSVFESCSKVYSVEVTGVQDGTKIFVGSWSKNKSADKSMNIAVGYDVASVSGTSSARGINYLYFTKEQGANNLIMGLSGSSQEFIFKDVAVKSFEYGALISTSVKDLVKTNITRVNGSLVQNKTANSFILLTGSLTAPLSFTTEKTLYDVVFSASVKPTGAAHSYDIVAYGAFDKFDTSGIGYQFRSESVGSFNGTPLADQGAFYTQQIIPETSFPYESPTPIITVVNDSPIALTDSTSVEVALAPSYKFEPEITYALKLSVDNAIFFQFKAANEYTTVELTDNSTVNNNERVVTIRCSQDIYMPTDDDVSSLVYPLTLKQNFVTFKGLGFDLEKTIYCSVIYTEENQPKPQTAAVLLVIHTEEDFINIYEGTPYISSISRATGSTVIQSEKFKILADSIDDKGNGFNNLADDYNLLFVKLEMISSGQISPDGAIPTGLDANDKLLFCLADSPVALCNDTSSGVSQPDRGTTTATAPVKLIEAKVKYLLSSRQEDNTTTYFVQAVDGYLPSSTYIIVDSSFLTVGHMATFRLTVGYAVATSFEEMRGGNMKDQMMVYFNNNNANTTDIHLQFVKLQAALPSSQAPGYVLQMSYDMKKGSTDGKVTTPDYSKITAILCPDYPEISVPDPDTGRLCVTTSLRADNAGAVASLDGACAKTGCAIKIWYLTLIPTEINPKYIPFSNIVIKEELVLVKDKSSIFNFLPNMQTVVPYAIPLNTSVRLDNMLLSVKISTYDVSTLFVCFSSSTPQETISSNCLDQRQKTGTSDLEIDLEFKTEWLDGVNTYDYGVYLYMTLVGPSDPSMYSPESNGMVSFGFKSGLPVNKLNYKTLYVTSFSQGIAPLSEPLMFYYLTLDNAIEANVSKLVFALIPPTITTTTKNTPDFYSNSKLRFDIYPNTTSVSSSPAGVSDSFSITKSENGLIVFPLGEELLRVGITDVSRGFTVKITPVYETFRLSNVGAEYEYDVGVGLFYEDTPDFKALSLVQVTPQYSEIIRAPMEPTAGASFGTSFRLAPGSELSNRFPDYSGLLMMPCKGLPTVYEASGSSVNTAFPSSTSNDKVTHYNVNNDDLSKVYPFPSSGSLNKYMTVEIGPDPNSTDVAEFSYVIMGNSNSICIPRQPMSHLISVLESVQLNGKPYVSIGFNPTAATDECAAKMSGEPIVEYTMYHYKVSTQSSISVPEDLSPYEIMPTVCGLMTYGTPSILDSFGEPVWTQAKKGAASAVLTSNVVFDIVDPEDDDREIQFIFNIIARIRGATGSKYMKYAYNGVVVKSSSFESVQDGFPAQDYEGVTAAITVPLSPTVIPNSDATKFRYYTNRFYAQMEVSDVINTDSVSSLMCINNGPQSCVSSTDPDESEVSFSATKGKRVNLIFDLEENPNNSGFESVVHYSMMYAPFLLKEGASVNLEAFGVSLTSLYSSSFLGESSENFQPTKYFVKVSNDIENGHPSMDVGLIDIRNTSNTTVSSLPNVNLAVSFDMKYLNNEQLVGNGQTCGFHVAICSEFIETDTEDYLGGSKEIGRSCAYLAKVVTGVTSGAAAKLEIDIPFGHNASTGRNEVFINNTSTVFNARDEFNIQREGRYFLVMVSDNILPGFEWEVQTTVNFPLDITIDKTGERHKMAVSTPRVYVGRNIYTTIYNDNTQAESDQDFCGLYLYPTYKTTTSYTANVCASSKNPYPQNSKGDCDIAFATISDGSTYIQFPCRSLNSQKGQTYFNIDMVSIFNNNSAFAIEVVRSTRLSASTPSASFKLDQLFNIQKVGDQYYCGYNPVVKLNTDSPIDIIPIACITKYEYYYDVSQDMNGNDFDGFTVAIEPSGGADSPFFKDYSYDNDPTHLEGIFYLFGSGEQSVLGSAYLPKTAKDLHTKGLQVLSFSKSEIKQDTHSGKTVVSFGLEVNIVKVIDFISFYNDNKDLDVKISAGVVTLNSGETGVVSLDKDNSSGPSLVYVSEVNEPNSPMFYSMFMVAGNSDLKTELVISPCTGSPVVYASPYSLHPSATAGQHEWEGMSTNGYEVQFTLGSDSPQSFNNTIWSISIEATENNKYELYPNNSHFRPVQTSNYIAVVGLSESEKEDKKARFAVEFSYFDVPSDIDPSIVQGSEIRYYLFGFEDKSANYKTACATTYNGKSLFVNSVTGVDYIVRSKNGEKTLRLLANNSEVELSKIKRVQVVAKYTALDGATWSSHSSGADVGSTATGFPWWGILLIVIGVLLVLAGVGLGVYFLIRHRKKQSDYLMETDEGKVVPHGDQESSEANMAPKFIS